MIIYKTTNLLNNKIYIGQFNGKSKYYIGGGKYFKRAVNKYGKENFKFEIITEGDFNIELTDYLEIHYIRLYNSTHPEIGYNIAPGGGGRIAYKLSEEHKRKISISSNGKIKKPCSEEHKQKISIANKGKIGLKGYKHSEQFKINCKNRMLGTKVSNKTKQKQSLAKLGKLKSEETKLKMSKAKSIPIIQLTLNNEFIKEWESMNFAGRELKLNIANIHSCCNNKRNKCGNFKWIYKNLNNI